MLEVYSKDKNDVLLESGSSTQGLSFIDAQNRLQKNGKNLLTGKKKKSEFVKFLGQFKDVLILVLIASCMLSIVIGIINKTVDEFIDAGIIMLVVLINSIIGYVQERKSEQAMQALKNMTKPYCKVFREGVIHKIKSEELVIGDIVVLEAGDIVPADLRLIETQSLKIEESALTGESIPRHIEKGEEIISGSINMTGVIRVRTTREFGESTVSKILDLVENASSRKSKSEDFISKFARIYTPAVCIGALLLAIIPPLANLMLGGPASWHIWIYRALTFLVISCPCALVISIPLSFFAGLGGASNAGILIKGSNYIETLSKTKTVVFDKTGTLTEGVFC